MATARKNHKKEQEKLPERDFLREYEEIMKLVGRNMNSIETEWNNNGGRIKKFSLFDKTPTPILSNNSQPFNL